MKINTSIRNEQKNVTVTKEIRQLIKDAVKSSFQHVGVSIANLFVSNIDVDVSVMLVDNEEIQNLNSLHRNMDKPTDVLSFPLLEFDENGNATEESIDFAVESESLELGDIVISLETAQCQAAEYGHGIEREIAFLTVHSMLHLMGYDHMDKPQEDEMFSLQKMILNKMGLVRNEID